MLNYSIYILFTFIFSIITAQPPIVDISCLIKSEANHITTQSTNDFNDCTVALQDIGVAVRKWGFFTVTNHGINQTLINELLYQSKHFFSLNNSQIYDPIRRLVNNSRGYTDLEYTKQKVDAKRVFDIGHTPYPELDERDPLNIVLGQHFFYMLSYMLQCNILIY